MAMGKRKRHTWPTETKEAIIAAIDGNIMSREEAAETYGVPLDTVKRWARGKNISDVQIKNDPKNGGTLSERMENLRDKCLDRMDSLVDGHGTTFRDLTTATGVLTDKVRLLRGEPTGITEMRDGSDFRAEIERKLSTADESGSPPEVL